MSLRIFDKTLSGGFRSISLDEIPDPDGETVVWVDVEGTSSELIDALVERFGFHLLAIEDIRERSQRPKVDIYGDDLFVVLYTIDPPDDAPRIPVSELSMFINTHSVVTIHREPIDELDDAAHRWSEHCKDVSPGTTAMLVYTICDSIVDGYFPCLDAFGDRIEDLEESLFERSDASTLQQIFSLKRQLLEMRRVIAPTRDVFNAFTRRELPILGDMSLAYFQDVYDHVVRTTDTIDSYRDILSSVIDVHLTIVSNNLNQTVRTLTVVSIILMTLALIAGIYGMNFDHMPELTWRYGYFIVLAGMVVLGSSLAYVFRRVGWW